MSDTSQKSGAQIPKPKMIKLPPPTKNFRTILKGL